MGTLSQQAIAPLEEHLLICDTCRQQLEGSDDLVRAVRHAAAGAREETEPAWKSWRIPRLAPVMAAAVLLIVAAGLALRTGRNGTIAPLAVALEATRGSVRAARVPSGRPLLLQPGMEGLASFPEYRIEVVGPSGDLVWRSTVSAGGAANAPSFSPGTYFVRLRNPSGDLLREYALEVRAGR
jgi:hypothetical protein